MAQSNKISLNGVQLTFRNAEGAIKKTMANGRIKGQFNTNGAKTFAITLNEEQALAMEADGFNVKWPKPREDIDPAEDNRQPTLMVTITNSADKQIHHSVSVFVVAGTDVNDPGVKLPHENYDQIDDMDIMFADVNMNVYDWEVNGKQGKKVYLQAMKLYIREVDFSNPTY